MRIARNATQLREALAQADPDAVVGFVPTMGFLHEGHLSLVDVARANGATFLVASIFVNPAQFGPKEDFSSYPRDEEADVRLLNSRQVDLLFAPSAEEIYPQGFLTTVHVAGVSEPLEGTRRPGHFDGVATVVLKLFNMVSPHIAIFGRKDAQQCAVIAQMTRDLDLPVKLVFGETIREEDGLAMSSRNAYLNASERALAPALQQALKAGSELLLRGNSDVLHIEEAMKKSLFRFDQVELDYLCLVDPQTFATPVDFHRDLLLVGAVRLGKTRLIDNILLPYSAVTHSSPHRTVSSPSRELDDLHSGASV